MNEIEKKYFEAFKDFITASPKLTLINASSKYPNELSVSYIEDENDDDDDEINSSNTLWFHTFLFFSWEKAIKKSDIYFTSKVNPVDGYIPDFLISPTDFGNIHLAIEIDGHEWHEKTKEQAANDRRKDRAYLKHNIIPIRFTGSEVYHDPISCVRETLEILARYLEREEYLYSRGRMDYQYDYNFGAVPIEEKQEETTEKPIEREICML